jgi:Zc3h12a-like Ribonuclease NYN domain
VKKPTTHLVVDGSNIATEGRTLPSLTQLEEAVDEFVAQTKFDNVIVVVDATFGHRISTKERRWFDELVATNRIISPPAGAVGRGDAFILQIATRANATVLSNDSFQEFHGTHTWLFDEGRLYGGKPVPHVGWVFVSRTPVRGPTSRRAVKHAKTPTTVVEQPTLIEPAHTRTESRSTRSRANATIEEPPPMVVDATEQEAKPTKRRSRRGRAPVVEAARQPETAIDKRFNETLAFQRFSAAHPVNDLVEVVVDRFSSHGAYARVEDVEVYIPTKSLSDPPPARARDVLTLGEPTIVAIDRYDDVACGIDVRGIRIDEQDSYYDSRRASSSIDSSNNLSDDTPSEGSEQPTRRSEQVATKKAAAKKPAKKAPAKKAAAKKAPAKKAAAKKAPAKKAAAKKAPAKKAAKKK